MYFALGGGLLFAPSSNTMNALGVIFDLKLQWSNKVANSVRKANSALHAINTQPAFGC